MADFQGTPARYRLAGQTIAIDRGMAELEPFRAQEQGTPLQPVPGDLAEMPAQLPARQVRGWLADKLSTLTLWQDGGGSLIEIPGAGRFWTAADGRLIAQVSQEPSARPAFLAEALLGPPLVLALAMRGTWCLHASALLCQGSLFAFLGESGQGKSTLAGYLAGCPGWRLVADDILPVSMQTGQLTAWPHFPQLKLPVQEQPGPGLPEQIALDKICVLAEIAADEEPSLQRLVPAKAAPALLSSTAGARLFDPDLLARHLDFCTHAASGTLVYRLGYPRRLEALAAVRQLLELPC